MIFNIGGIILGMILLLGGAELLVRGSSSIARYFKISNVIIGLTIVSFGTSLPELVVTTLASIQGSADIALGNILGSNITNILLVLSITALITPIAIKSRALKREVPIAIFGALLLIVMGGSIFGTPNMISRPEGFLLIAVFSCFLWYIIRLFTNERISSTQPESAPNYGIEGSSPKIAGLLIVIGVASLGLGGDMLVTHASEVAKILGLSEAFIGIVIIGIGTSMPELATSAVAAFKKEVDLAIGNIIGSNIFNIFWVVGLSAAIRPLYFNPVLIVDAVVGLGAVLLLSVFLLFYKKRFVLSRPEALLMLAAFVGYVTYIYIRG